MKKKMLALLLTLCLVMSCFSLTASAEEGATGIADLSITYGDNEVESQQVDGSYIFTAPGGTLVKDYTAQVTLAEGAAFTVTNPQAGDLYVAAVGENQATLKFNYSVGAVNLNDDAFALTLTKGSDGTWSGGFQNASVLTLDMLAGYLAGQDIQLAAGSLGAGSPAQSLLVNLDDQNVVMALCAPGAAVYTVTYVVEDDTITWQLPAGAALEGIVVEPASGGTIAGWYMDSEHDTQLAEDATVTGDVTLYAAVTGGTTPPDPPEEDTFYDLLTGGETAVIKTDSDWEIFVQYASEVDPGQLIILEKDIDCDDASYPALTFAGNFDGGNHSISNVTFEPVDHPSTGEEVAGMFATLGHGQIVANLELRNVTVEYSANYAGALVGMADGWSGDEVLIQNVQVYGSSLTDGVSGRSAGGIAGFCRHTDILYCSSRDLRITGVVNGGGIVGINEDTVELCFSTSSPTALPSLLGGSSGGVVGKNVRGGRALNSWCYVANVMGSSDQGGANTGSTQVPEGTSATDFVNVYGFNQSCWALSEDLPADFNPDVVSYQFPVES